MSSIFSRNKICINIIFLTFSAISLAQKTDVVKMKNGDHITGEIKRLELGILVFKTDHAGTINIKWNKIKNIKTNNIYEVELEDGRVYYGSTKPGDKDSSLLIKGVTLENTLFMILIVKITRIKETFWEILNGYIELGFGYTKANGIGEFNFGFNGKYRTKIFYAELTLHLNMN